MRTIHGEIVRLAVPSILANITIPLVGLVDTAIVGHISDATAIGGIAIGTMLFDLLYWNFGFLRIGTSGLTAQAYGREGQNANGREGECFRILRQGVLIALAASVLVWLLQWLFVTCVLWCVPCSQEVAQIAREYFFIRIWAAPATLTLLALKGWFIGMQDTRSPMAVDIVVNGVNMAASYLLAVTAGCGVAGVAWGTLIAQYSGLVLACAILVFRYRVRIKGGLVNRDALFNGEKGEWGRYFRFNGNLFVRSLCFMVVYVGFTSLASQYGDTQLAVSSIYMKLFMFFSYFVDGFAYAGEAMVGKAFGEIKAGGQEPDGHVSEIVRLLFVWSLGVGALFTVIYAVWGMSCVGLLTGEQAVIEASRPYIGWLIAMPIVSTLAFMWDGVYTGATAGREIRNAMIWAAVAFVFIYGVGEWAIGGEERMAALTVLFAAYFAHLFARVIYLTVYWRKTYVSEINQ